MIEGKMLDHYVLLDTMELKHFRISSNCTFSILIDTISVCCLFFIPPLKIVWVWIEQGWLLFVRWQRSNSKIFASWALGFPFDRGPSILFQVEGIVVGNGHIHPYRSKWLKKLLWTRNWFKCTFSIFLDISIFRLYSNPNLDLFYKILYHSGKNVSFINKTFPAVFHICIYMLNMFDL